MAKKVAKPKGRKEFVEMWLGRIDDAIAKREYMRERFWDKCREFDAGKQFNRAPHIKSNDMVINIIKDNNTKQLSSIYARNPKPVVTPKIGDGPALSPEDISTSDRAKTMEDLLKQVIEDDNGRWIFQDELESAVYEAFLSIGIVKSVYEPEMQKNPLAGQMVIGETGEEVLDPVTGEPILEPDEIIVDEFYGVQCIDPDMHFVSANTKDNGRDMDFDGEEMFWSLEKVRGFKMFRQDARSKVEPTDTFQLSPEEERFKNKREKKTLRKTNVHQTLGPDAKSKTGGEVKDPQKQLVRLFWVYDHTPVVDKDTGETKRFQYVFAEGMEEDFLMKREWPKGIEGGVYSYLQFRKGGKAFYKIPPSFDLLDLNVELNEAQSHMRVLRRRNKRKILLDTGALKSADEADKLQSDIDLEVVETKVGINPGQAMQVIEAGGPTSADLTAVQSVNVLFTRLAGQTPESFGQSGAPTLGQSELQAGASNTLKSYDHNKLIRFLGMILKKVAQLMQANLETPRAVERIGEDGGRFWVKIDDPRQIEGEFEFKIDAESTQPKNQLTDELMQNKKLQMLFQWGLDSFIKPEVLVREIMKRSPFDQEVVKSAQELQAQQTAEQFEAIRQQERLSQAGALPEQAQGRQNTGQGKGGGQIPTTQEGVTQSIRQQGRPTSAGGNNA